MARAIVVFLLLAGGAAAAAPALDWRWTRTDVALEAASLAAIAADCVSTRYMLQRDENVHETNPLLGRRPSGWTIAGWCTVAAVSHVALAAVVPRPVRPVLQVVTIAVESGLAMNNAIGLAFGARW